LVAIGLLAGFLIGEWRGRLVAEKQMAARAASLKRLPEDGQAALETALGYLRTGRASEALRDLKDLKNRYPSASSLSYLAALAALQSGQFPVAEQMANESIKSRQRVSDALALVSVVEGRRAGSPGSKKEEDLLRAAITADQANPNVQVEMGRFLRESGRPDEARAALRAALLRMEPVDPRAVAETTLALMDAEAGALTPEARERLPRSAVPWVDAFTRLQQGDYAGAAGSLRLARQQTAQEVFRYALGDPVFRPYRDRPELAEFLQ
jgi:tetratricopeptide (TPR) repeat protein